MTFSPSLQDGTGAYIAIIIVLDTFPPSLVIPIKNELWKGPSYDSCSE